MKLPSAKDPEAVLSTFLSAELEIQFGGSMTRLDTTVAPEIF